MKKETITAARGKKTEITYIIFSFCQSINNTVGWGEKVIWPHNTVFMFSGE